MAFFAQYNLTPVSLNLGYAVFNDIPLFYVVVGAMLIGLGIGYLSYLIHSLSTAFTIHGKDHALKQAKEEVAELTKRVHQLELENGKLKKTSKIPFDDKAL